MPLSTLNIPAADRQVHLTDFGFILVLRTVAPDGDAEYWATNDLTMLAAQRDEVAHQCWSIEAYHRRIKQCCGVERAHVRKARAQHNHMLLAVRAFVRLEVDRVQTGLSWYVAKTDIVRDAICVYLTNPAIRLYATA